MPLASGFFPQENNTTTISGRMYFNFIFSRIDSSKLNNICQNLLYLWLNFITKKRLPLKQKTVVYVNRIPKVYIFLKIVIKVISTPSNSSVRVSFNVEEFNVLIVNV